MLCQVEEHTSYSTHCAAAPYAAEHVDSLRQSHKGCQVQGHETSKQREPHMRSVPHLVLSPPRCMAYSSLGRGWSCPGCSVSGLSGWSSALLDEATIRHNDGKPRLMTKGKCRNLGPEQQTTAWP